MRPCRGSSSRRTPSARSAAKPSVTRRAHGIGGNPSLINKARQAAVTAGVPINAVSVSPLRITLWCDRPHVDELVRAIHATFIG